MLIGGVILYASLAQKLVATGVGTVHVGNRNGTEWKKLYETLLSVVL